MKPSNALTLFPQFDKDMKIQDLALGPITRGRAKKIKEQLENQMVYLLDDSKSSKIVPCLINLLVIEIVQISFNCNRLNFRFVTWI